MSTSSQKRSDEFLKISGQFKLGALVTEAPHPVTANLSESAKGDAAQALDLLFQIDSDVLEKFREFVESGRAVHIKETVMRALQSSGRIFFTGCGSTGRLGVLLNAVWRDFWQRQRARGFAAAEDLENRTFSVMAGGDYALIKSVEGFEDFTAFGRKQIRDLGVRGADVVFAITEGGETPFVIGTVWEGLKWGAKVYFVYNNPDEVLCRHIERSREVIEDAHIEKINLTTGPMAVAGSTRMQATSIQLCVLLTVLEMVAREALGFESASVPKKFLEKLTEMHATLKSPALLAQLARLVELEESAYRAGRKTSYFADGFGIDVLTDTTERSPTYCTPPFRKSNSKTAAESWAFLFLPQKDTSGAWRHVLKREPRCIEWGANEIRVLVDEEKFARMLAAVRQIGRAELIRFEIGSDGLKHRRLRKGDCAVAIVGESEKASLLSADGFYHVQLEAARKARARVGLVYFCSNRHLTRHGEMKAGDTALFQKSGILPPSGAKSDTVQVLVPLPETDLLLDGVTRVAVKLVLNALSTCTMVRLGRVMGNFMIYVVPSNLKLIDRATRYIVQLTGLTYEAANALLFEVIEYVEPRMKSDQAYPPVVGLAILRARHKLTNEEAEKKLK